MSLQLIGEQHKVPGQNGIREDLINHMSGGATAHGVTIAGRINTLFIEMPDKVGDWGGQDLQAMLAVTIDKYRKLQGSAVTDGKVNGYLDQQIDEICAIRPLDKQSPPPLQEVIKHAIKQGVDVKFVDTAPEYLKEYAKQKMEEMQRQGVAANNPLMQDLAAFRDFPEDRVMLSNTGLML